MIARKPLMTAEQALDQHRLFYQDCQGPMLDITNRYKRRHDPLFQGVMYECAVHRGATVDATQRKLPGFSEKKGRK